VDAVSPAGPPGVQVLARGTARHRDAWIDTTATYYVAPSGAAVLDSATIDTGCLSRGACYELAVPAPTRAAMSALVVQVVTAFAVPRFGATHPAVPTPGLTGAALASRYGGLVTGHSLREDDD